MNFTEEQVRDCVFGGLDGTVVETIQGDDGRWSRTNRTIIEKDGKFYALFWEEGLTENQDNEFEEQDAKEVRSIDTVVTKKTWVRVDAET